MKIRRLWIALLAVLVLLSACTRVNAAWQKQIDLGNKYLSDGDYEEAILAFSVAIDIDPENPEGYIYRGDAYVEAAKELIRDGEYDQAQEYLENAEEDYEEAEDLDYEDEDALEDCLEYLEKIRDRLEEEKEFMEGSGWAEDFPGEQIVFPENVPYEPAEVEDAYAEAYENVFDGSTYCVHIPRFVFPDDRAAMLNEQIYFGTMGILNEYSYQEPPYDGQPNVSVSYYLGQGKGLASVLMPVYVQNSGVQFFCIYHMDVATGQEATDQDVMAAFGYTEETFRQKAREAVRAFYEGAYVLEKETSPADYTWALEENLSDQNIQNIRPYVDSLGRLCMTVWMNAPNGWGWEIMMCVEDATQILMEVPCAIHG